MAAHPKTLRVVDARAVTPSTRLLEIECVDGPPLEAVGGKYVIVNTGVVSGEKPVKRAYSLLAAAGASGRAHLTIKRLEQGPGSSAMHDVAVGAELSFSGPWGKLLPEEGVDARTLVVATDTGITAALGVVEQAGAADAGGVELLWLRGEDETFLDVEGVRSRVERTGARFHHALIPPVRTAARLSAAAGHIEGRVAALDPKLVIASGDGAIVHPLRDRLRSAPFAVRDVRIECFFHNPERKSA